MTSKRSSRIPPFHVMEILEKAHELEAGGRNIIHLEIGEPDFDTPEPVIAAAQKALENGMTQYTHSMGLPSLRKAIADHYNSRYGVNVSADNIIVTSGTSPAMVLIFSALMDPGEELILSNPCYACYPNILEFVGGVPRYIRVHEDNGFKYPPAELAENIDPAVKGVLVNSPSNPTGIVLDEKDMKDVVDSVDGRTYIISDEIYHGLVYEGRESSILEFTDKCFVLNGFSKLYAMTGWRLGYLICPEEFVRPIQKIQQNLFICANSFVQQAGIAALNETKDYTEEMVNTYNRRREYLLGALKGLGFGIAIEPTGAFYIFANAKKFTDDVYSFCFELLENAGVAITPGIDFGDGGKEFVRFSYANSIDNIKEGIKRLGEYLDKQ